MPSFLTPILRDPGGQFLLRNAQSGAVVATRILTAFDSETRNRGLLHLSTLDREVALILAPTFAIHTFFMKFPIDVLFVARDGSIMKIRRSVQPWRAVVAWRGFAAVEMRGGALDGAELRLNDRLSVDPAGTVRV